MSKEIPYKIYLEEKEICIISLKFIVNVSRCIQRFFQTICPGKRRGAIHFIKIPDLLRNLYICCGIIQFLSGKLLTENRCEFFQSNRF